MQPFTTLPEEEDANLHALQATASAKKKVSIYENNIDDDDGYFIGSRDGREDGPHHDFAAEGAAAAAAAEAAVPNISKPSLLSNLTEHENEAETKLMQAIDEERKKMMQQHKQGGGGVSSRSRRALLEGSRLPSRPLVAGIDKDEEVPLGTRAKYLMALHSQGDRIQQPFMDPINEEEEDNDDDLAQASPADRIYMAGSVLLAAAAAGGSTRHGGTIDDEFGVAAPSTEAFGPHDEPQHDLEESPHRPNNKHKFAGRLFAFPAHARDGIERAMEATTQEWRNVQDFFRPHSGSMIRTLLYTLLIAIPSMAAAFVLFYYTDNPPTGRCNDENPDACTGEAASASWWIIFLGVRQVITWWVARLTDMILIDWLVLQHVWIIRILGPHVSLMVVQSKGWPNVLFWWMLWNAMILYGSGSFPKHWLYFQNEIKMFTSENPAGTVSTDEWFRVVIISGVIVAACVTLKRYYMGLHLGGRLHARFNDRLEALLKRITLVSELAIWARRKRDKGATFQEYVQKQRRKQVAAVAGVSISDGNSVGFAAGRGPKSASSSTNSLAQLGKPEAPALVRSTSAVADSVTACDNIRNSLLKGETIEYSTILDPWEEPEHGGGDAVTGNQIIEFRQAFNIMTRPYFFSSAFGSANTREECAISADHLFLRLLKLMGEEECINLDELLWWMYKGTAGNKVGNQPSRAEEMAEMLTPDLEGNIGLLDFVKGVDAVYKEVRLLENAVQNASDVDRSYELLVNVLFYFVMLCVILAASGQDVMGFLLAFSGFIVAFAFMIGPGSAQIFEGILLVLARQPYDIGDRVAIANVEEVPGPDGSAHWMIEGVDLMTTTARLTATGEVATFSNGSLARSRIINMKRSTNPTVYVRVRFGTDVSYSTILIFRKAVQMFVEERNQEWVKFSGFRAGRIESQENYVEYSIVLQHRQPWQNLVPILDSKAAVASFCVEIQKQLNCVYKAPSKPIELSLKGRKSISAALMLPDLQILSKADSRDRVAEGKEAAAVDEDENEPLPRELSAEKLQEFGAKWFSPKPST